MVGTSEPWGPQEPGAAGGQAESRPGQAAENQPDQSRPHILAGETEAIQDHDMQCGVWASLTRPDQPGLEGK